MISWGALPVVLDLISFVPLIVATRQGDAAPSRVAWTMWAALNAAWLASQYARGARGAAWLSGAEMTGCAVLAVLCWLRPANPAEDMPGWLTVTMTAGVAAALDTLILASATTALLLAAGVDAVATAANAWKIWQDPGSEPPLTWWLFGGAAVLNVRAVHGTWMPYLDGGWWALYLYSLTSVCSAALILAVITATGGYRRQNWQAARASQPWWRKDSL